MINDRLDSAFDTWLLNFHESVKDIPEINDKWMYQLACCLCDDIPFGYETSHRLARYIFAYINTKKENASCHSDDLNLPYNELTLQNILDACKYVGYKPEDVTIFTYDRDSDRKVTALLNRVKGTQLLFDVFPNSIIMTRMSDASCQSREFQNFVSIANWFEKDQESDKSNTSSE